MLFLFANGFYKLNPDSFILNKLNPDEDKKG